MQRTRRPSWCTSADRRQASLRDRKGRSPDNIVKTYDLNKHPNLMTFIGDQIQGDWILHVADYARVDTGKLVSWGIKLSIQQVGRKTLKKEASPNQTVPDNDPSGIESVIHVGKSGRIVNLDVSVDIIHTWIGDLRVTLVEPSGEEVNLHNLKGYSRDGIKRVYSTKSDGRLRVLVGKEMKGDWRLKVADYAREDTGTLNHWVLDLVYE